VGLSKAGKSGIQTSPKLPSFPFLNFCFRDKLNNWMDMDIKRTLQNTTTFFKNFSAKMLREIVARLVLQVGQVEP
jgi:hypothetical protein